MNARTETLSEKGQAALAYAGRGWKVCPLRDGTKSDHLTGHGGYHNATSDPDQVRKWWMQWPDANIGLNLEASGLVVLDADTYKPDCGWQNYIEGREAPWTLIQKSARGGTHYIYQAEQGVEYLGKLCQGVDIKHKGYILLEPSTFEGGQYRFETDDEPEPCPDWVPRKAGAPEGAKQTVTEDDRLLILHRLADAPNDLSREDWVRLCFALKHALGDDGREAWLDFCNRFPGEKKQGEAERVWDTAKPDGTSNAGTIFYLLQTPAQKAVAPKTFNLVAVGDLEYRPPVFLAEGLIETETLGLLFGDPGCGKSFLAADLSLSVATGEPFHGRAVKQGTVIYIAGEGHNGLARRFNAWAQHHGRSLKGVPMFKSERAAQFLDGASAQSVTNAVRSLAAKVGEPALIVVDTLARNFGGGDENSTQEMGQFIAAMDDLRSNWPECVLLIVHHSGHAEKQRARGAMALKGALDFEYRLEKEGDALTLTNTKMKDAEPPVDQVFALETVDLERGGSSAVLVEGEAVVRRVRLTATQMLGLTTYKTAALAHGVWDDGAFKGVQLEDWRAEFYRKHTGDTSEAKKKAFQRVRKDLVDYGKMTATDDVYLACDPAVSLEILMSGTDGTIPGHVPS
ncbi:hypothetical protein EOW65_17685 [Sinirhodobacter ferrireducens]|uniref:DNA primase/polymerase bifunctional N-terminal domain-containing protein n=1 Tax=Paenirhodobacter ferrireducens TaxID=1215032 RepID=A0A443L702_9RHOB|nr:AAA family ATPase [Sinirhodobacter ferrireducens]RWR44976.1 hypothetical protein EOW65_17685 [Sinirhodobacter ferrireducens]